MFNEQPFRLGSLSIYAWQIKEVDFTDQDQGAIDISLAEPFNTTLQVERQSEIGKRFMIWLYPHYGVDVPF